MDYISKEKKYMMQTYGRFPIVIESGINSTVKDENGKEYIDFTSGIGVNSIGYNDKDWVNAISEQAGNLQHISNLFYNKKQIGLAEKIIKISKMSRIFLANSGAEANEGAIKLARKYSFDKYGHNRSNIISLKNSFHGRTITTLKATGQEKFHDFFFPFTEGFIYADADDYNDVINKIDDTVCAVIMESIQGEGGVYPLEKEFVSKIYEVCKKKDVLIIFDEIQTGIGRTGKVFGYEYFDVEPDIVTVAKGLGGGLPIGGFICNKKLEDVLSAGHHATTFGGNPICCAGSLVVLDKVCNADFLEEVNKKGKYIIDRLKTIKSPLIKDIRGRGLMIGIEVDCTPKDIVLKCIDKGLILLTAGTNTLRLLPPLTISYNEIDKGLDILFSVL